MRYVLFPLFVLALIIVVAIPASAQDAQAPVELLEEPTPQPENPQVLEPDPFNIPGSEDPDKLDLPFENYSDIPPEALDEMQQFYEDCQANHMLSSHYECKCWSTRFLEERIRMGPIKPALSVSLSIANECFNIPGAAGYALKKCQGYGTATYDGGMSPEEYCQCIANNYAIQLSYMEGQQLTRQSSNSMITSAILRCKTPNPGDINVFKRLDQ
jgi:hypothetical protein